jgi:hypothetical protein
VNALFAEYHSKAIVGGVDTGGTLELVYNPTFDREDDNRFQYPNWIITDMRFLNEYTAVKSRGGITIRVNRELKREHNFPGQPHISETALNNENFDVVIHNNGTLEELVEKVRGVLLHLNIIE